MERSPPPASPSTGPSPTTIDNCTIVSNKATKGGGIVLNDQWAGLIARNSIVYSNTSDMAIHGLASWSKVFCTNVCTSSTNNFTALGNTGNITNKPEFADFAVQNFRLTSRSPCVNAGTNFSWMFGTLDLDGQDRIREGIVDMGCYELHRLHGTVITIQ